MRAVDRRSRGGRVFARLFRRAPARPGEAYGAPGAGSSRGIEIATAATLVFLWWLSTRLGWVDPLFLPSPGAVVRRFLQFWSEEFAGGTILDHALWSLYRVFTAFALACVTAIPIGLAMGVNRVARGVFDPPIEFYRPIPPLGYLPLTVIWLGIGDLQKIVLIFLAMFAPMAIAARAGVRAVSIEQIHAAWSLGASRAQVVREVVLPAALPDILTGMRIGIGFGWTTLVAAEMVAAEQGIGHMVLSASDFLVTDVVMLGILVIGLIAWLFDLGMRTLERRLVPWRGRT